MKIHNRVFITTVNFYRIVNSECVWIFDRLIVLLFAETVYKKKSLPESPPSGRRASLRRRLRQCRMKSMLGNGVSTLDARTVPSVALNCLVWLGSHSLRDFYARNITNKWPSSSQPSQAASYSRFNFSGLTEELRLQNCHPALGTLRLNYE